MHTEFLSGSPTKMGYLKDLVADEKTIGGETINSVTGQCFQFTVKDDV
jgi:hypothetical protein